MLFRTKKFKNPHFSHKDRDSAVKKQRKSGIYEKSVKKEGCEFARNAVLSKNVLPLYIFDSRFMQAKRKYRQKCTSMYTFDSGFWQNQNIASAWNLPPSMAVASFFTRAVT